MAKITQTGTALKEMDYLEEKPILSKDTSKMRILLVDLDTNSRRKPFPNLALMKLSAFYKTKGDEVFLNFPLCQPDLTYASCVFTWNARNLQGFNPAIHTGGSGINLEAKLPEEIEHLMPDYSLYPNTNFSVGFTSRGCIQRCPWCIVPKKEGSIKPWASIYEFWDKRHQKIMLFDNNLLASPNWKETLSALIKEKIEVDFNQGLDIRLLDDEKVNFLKRVQTKVLRFSFDHLSYEKAVREGIQLLLKAGISSRKLSFYVLTGFNGDETTVERVEILKHYNVDIYPMLYKGKDGKEPKPNPLLFSLNGYHGSRQNFRKFQRVISNGGKVIGLPRSKEIHI